MLERKRIIEEITVYFSVFQYYVQSNSKRGRVDINIISENFIACILNILKGWDLKNTNSLNSNSPAIDLLDISNRIGIQVTSRCDSRKINKTIKTLSESEFREKITDLYFFSLSPKQKKYTIKHECPFVNFSISNILDFDYVIREAELYSINGDKLDKLYVEVLRSFSDWPKKVVEKITSLNDHSNYSDKPLIDESLKSILERSFLTGESVKAKIILLIEKNEIIEAMTLLDELADSRTMLAARELMDIANIYSLLKSEKADVFFAKAINLNPNSVKDANIYAISLMHRGLLSDSIKIFNACLEKDLLSLREREIILGNLGFVYKNNAEYKKSIKYFKEALALSDTNSNVIGKIKHLNGLGSCYLNIEDFETSDYYFSQAKSLLNRALSTAKSQVEKNELRITKSNLLTNIAIRLKNLSVLNGDKELLSRAMDFLEQAIDISEIMNDERSLMRHYGNMANILRLLDKNNDFRDYNKRSYELANKLNDKRSKIVCILNDGVVDMEEGLFIIAKDKFKIAINECGDTYPKLHANLNANLALVCQALNENSEAARYFNIAEKEYVKYGMFKSLKLLHDKYSKI